MTNKHDPRRFKPRAARGYPREADGILSVRKRNINKVTELKFRGRNTVQPVKFKTFGPGENGDPKPG